MAVNGYEYSQVFASWKVGDDVPRAPLWLHKLSKRNGQFLDAFLADHDQGDTLILKLTLGSGAAKNFIFAASFEDAGRSLYQFKQASWILGRVEVGVLVSPIHGTMVLTVTCASHSNGSMDIQAHTISGTMVFAKTYASHEHVRCFQLRAAIHKTLITENMITCNSVLKLIKSNEVGVHVIRGNAVITDVAMVKPTRRIRGKTRSQHLKLSHFFKVKKN